MEYGVYGDLTIKYPKPYSNYLRGTITLAWPHPAVPGPSKPAFKVYASSTHDDSGLGTYHRESPQVRHKSKLGM